jgi:hypothetical protein
MNRMRQGSRILLFHLLHRGVSPMLTKCSNPECFNHFLYMDEGKVFRFETRCASGGDPQFTKKKTAQKIEFFWLCSNCAARMTLLYREGQGVGVQTLEEAYRASAS